MSAGLGANARPARGSSTAWGAAAGGGGTTILPYGPAPDPRQAEPAGCHA